MGSLPGRFYPFAAIFSVAALVVFTNSASSQFLMASSNYIGKGAIISDLRLGTHLDKTRIVLDVSNPTDLSYKVSKDGKTTRLDLPKASWQRKQPLDGYAGGSIISVTYSAALNGSTLILRSDKAIRIKRPFFLSPDETRGYRIVIDMVPAPIRITEKVNKNLVASIDGIGALPGKVEVAQISKAQNPYIQRAFPEGNQRMQRQPKPRKTTSPQEPKIQQQVPRQNNQAQMKKDFLGLTTPYARGSLGLHIINEASNDGNGNYDTEFSPGFLMSIALGTRLENKFRVEGEFFYANATLKQLSGTVNNKVHNTEVVNGDMSTLAFMANVIYDFPNNSRLTPYVMGGVGLAGIFINEFSATEIAIADDMDWVFAAQLGAGTSFALDGRTNIEIGYRYFETENPEFSDVTGTPFKSIFSGHNFLVGARIDLN